MKFLEVTFGKDWKTTIAGYLAAGLMVAQEMLNTGNTNYWRIGLAVAIAIFGRVAGDSKKTPPTTPE
jgi:hypothetical protein